jgi:hypothetical protein
MDVKAAAGEASEENGEMLHNGKILSRLHVTAVWKAQLVSNEVGYSAEENFKQSVLKVQPGFTLVLIVKYKKKEIN